MLGDNHLFPNENEHKERRTGPPNRRIRTTDDRKVNKVEGRIGLPNRRMVTDDKKVTIVTGSGEYKGTINLNSAPVKVDCVSDYFIKSDFSFITLYNTTLMGQTEKVAFLNIKNIVVAIPHENIPSQRPELRHDAYVSIRLISGIGIINGKINLMGETKQLDRVSDLLNYPEKRWFIVYDASFKGRFIPEAIVNLDFISSVEG